MADTEEAANNPAGRVLWFMRELRAYNSKNAQLRGQPLMKTVTEVLGTAEGSVEAYLAVTKIRREIELIPGAMLPHSDIPGYDSIFEHYEEILKTGERIQLPRSCTLEQFMNPITSAGWASLKFADEVLRRSSVEKRLTAADTARYLGEVQGLISEVAGDIALSQPDRERIVRLLRQVEEALVNIRIFGADHAQEAIVTAAGVVRLDLWDRVAGKKWAQRFGAVMVALLMALDATANVVAIASVFNDSRTDTNVVSLPSERTQDRSAEADDDFDVFDGEVVEDAGT